MNLVKARFLKDGVPHGRAYTYQSDGELKVGELVDLTETKNGIIVEIDVPEAEVESFKDKLKTIKKISNEEKK